MGQEKECSNKNKCECPYTSCERHDRCCDCVAYHKNVDKSLPMCLRGVEK